MIYTSKETIEVPPLDILTFLFDSPHTPTTPETPLHAFADRPDQPLLQRHVLRFALQTAAFLKPRLPAYSPASPSPVPVISVLSSGHPLLPSLFFASIALGAIYSPIPPEASPAAVARRLGDGLASLLVCSADLAPSAREAVKLACLSWDRVWVYDTEAGTGEDGPRPVLYPLGREEEGGERNVQEGDVQEGRRRGCDYVTQSPLASWKRITDPVTAANTPVCLLYTSGTTSRTSQGKGVLLSHRNLIAEAYLPSCLHRPTYKQWAARPSDRSSATSPAPYFVPRVLGHLPPAHISCVQSNFINTHHDAGIVYWMRAFDLPRFLRHCAELQITYIFTAVPIYGAMAQLPREKARAMFGSLKLALSGGAHLPIKIRKKLGARLGAQVGGVVFEEVWGATELTGIATYLPPGDPREENIGGAGRLLPGMELRLVDHRGKDVPRGFPGEALIRGPVLMMGYYNNPEANEAAFAEGGWYRTGDVLSIDDKTGILFVGPRKVELIRTKKGPVSPLDLESLLLSHPLIADAAVVGIPAAAVSTTAADGTGRFMHFEAGACEVPRAYVVLAAAGDSDDPYGDNDGGTPVVLEDDDVVSFVADILPEARHMWLDGGVEFLPALPRNGAGKVLRWRLRNLYLSRMGIQDTR